MIIKYKTVVYIQKKNKAVMISVVAYVCWECYACVEMMYIHLKKYMSTGRDLQDTDSSSWGLY